MLKPTAMQDFETKAKFIFENHLPNLRIMLEEYRLGNDISGYSFTEILGVLMYELKLNNSLKEDVFRNIQNKEEENKENEED